MSRYRTTQGLDDPPGGDGDVSFQGVNANLDADKLPAGWLAGAENSRFRNGVCEPRLGVVKPGWLNVIDLGAGTMGPVSKFYGAGVWRDPATVSWVVLAADGGAYRCRPHNGRMALALPSGVKLLSRVTFTQAFNKVYCFRGKYLAPLLMSDVDTGFEDLIAHWDKTLAYAANQEVAYGPWKTVPTGGMTRNADLVKVVLAAPHGYVSGADITVSGSTQTEYNGRYNIAVVDEFTFTYHFAGSSTATATGSIAVSNMSQYWKANAAISANTAWSDASWTKIWNVLPNADDALFINNRLLVPTAYTPGSGNTSAAYSSTSTYTKKDFLISTDIEDEVHFTFQNEYRINQGADDEIAGLVKYNNDQVIVLKNRSWGILSNLRMDSSQVTLDMRGDGYGACAPAAACVAGKDVMFCASKRGLCSLRETELGTMQSRDVPFSNDLSRYVGRINWLAAGVMRLAWWDDRVYWAVPLDGASVNNAILVYDFRAESWCGVDTGSELTVQEWFVSDYNGLQRLFYIGSDGWVNLMEEAEGLDESALGWEPVVTRWSLRHFKANVEDPKRFARVQLVLETWNPSLTLTAGTEAAQSGVPMVINWQRNRARMAQPFDAPTVSMDNSANDFMKPGREDYSVALPAAGFYCGSGVGLGQFQEVTRRLSLRARAGRACGIEIVNNQGRCRLKSATIDTMAGARREGDFI